MSIREIQQFVRADKTNYLESYAGKNERLDKELNTTFKIFFYLSDTVNYIWNKSTPIDSDKSPWIVDSIIQLGRGMELLNSSLSLLVNNHIPANMYLFRSALNCFWFSYKFMSGGNEYGSSAWRTYNEGKGLSKKEIRQKEIEKVLNQDGLEHEGDGIVALFNGILHSDFETGYLYRKSDHGGSFELSPHDYETEELVSLFEESIVNLRGIMEFARSVIQSTFIDQNLEKLLEGECFQYRNMKILHTKSYRELWETLDKMEELDLKKYT